MLSRPSCAEIATYRRVVDDRVVELLEGADDPTLARARGVVELGLAHEQQHQELLLTDALHALHENPLAPAYREPAVARARVRSSSVAPMSFVEHAGGLVEIGAVASDAFRFDNEEPRHRVFLQPFAIGDRLVTVGEWKAFADAGGYDDPSLWLSEGLEWVRANGVRGPLYARRDGGALVTFGLEGTREAADDEPITNVSYYEAHALAAFLGARLPTEAEWEVFAAGVQVDGNFLESDALRARPPPTRERPAQLYGDAWEWTSSSYAPFPGFRAREGAIGEYNAKFMVSQLVLRGGSCFTPAGHVRASYRNFWHPDTRFQMTGVRLARS
jgi:ergothioneine biosynthesis protein EgtB